MPSNDEYLKEYFDKVFGEIKDDLIEVNKKLDYILHPEHGIYAELHKINSKADAAHRRIDVIEGRREKYRKLKDRITSAVIGGVMVFIIIEIIKQIAVSR